MFLRQLSVAKGEKKYTYLKVVESVWEHGRTVQRTLVNLGNAAGWSEEKLRELVRLLTEFLQMELVSLEDVRFGERRILGPYLALSALWERLGMDDILARAMAGCRADPGTLSCAKAMVLTRLVNPQSKKAVWESVSSDLQIPGVDGAALPLQCYYRTLEYLVRAKHEIEKAVHLRIRHLFNLDLSVVFYDVTSAYFEGSKCNKARHGYSREHRPDCVQIEIGLLVDSEGIPIGHEVFDGNVKDVATVLEVLERLGHDFEIRRCVFVGDDGMASEANLAEVEGRGYEYITSLSLGKSKIGREILAGLPPKREWEAVANANNMFLYPLRTEGRVRYIGSYNPERAKHSRLSRRRHLRECLAYLRQLQTPPKPRAKKKTLEEVLLCADRFIVRKGCRHLVRTRMGERLEWELDRAALRNARRADGLLILKTNSGTLSDREVALGYRTLWRVEDAFRHLKDGIHLRPIRHWSDPRVMGHVFVCVLSYMLECLYEKELRRAKALVSARQALSDLSSVITATLEVNGRQLRRRSQITPEQMRLLAAVGVKDVPEIW